MRRAALVLLLALFALPAAAQESQSSDEGRHRGGEATSTATTSAPSDSETDSNDTRERITRYDSDVTVARNGTLTVPVVVNGALTLPFIVDSGAADVTVSENVVRALLQKGSVSRSDFLDTVVARLADGSTIPSQRFRIRSLQVGDRVVENVVAGISPGSGTLLLGQSFLSRFKSWSIDNQRRVLVLN